MKDKVFESILAELVQQNGVHEGRMMSAPAIAYQKKVFAFYHQGKMCFGLGKLFDPDFEGIKDWSYLSPFVNKPPMKGWIFIPFHSREEWHHYTLLALDKIKMGTK